MRITELAIKKPILFIVLFALLGGLAAISYAKLNYELLPTLATPTVTIITAYPGASPTDVENTVTKKLENAVAAVSKSKKINATSAENMSIISIDFQDDANEDIAMQEVQRAVNTVASDLPNGVKAPILEKFNVNGLPVIKMAITAKIPPTELYHIFNDYIKPQLAKVSGVSNVKIIGGQAKELKIIANEDQLISTGTNIEQIKTALQNANISIPIGNVKDDQQELSINMDNKFTNIQAIENLIVKTYSDGSQITLKDIASVQDGIKDATVNSRLNGKTALAIFVSKQSDANAATVAKNIRKKLAEIEETYKAEALKCTIASDSSQFSLASAQQVYEDLGIAILLVALVMLVFLHSLRNALIIMISIPASLFITAIVMYLLGFTLNLMTLLAVSLVIGVLVDDSIVVLENIYHHLELGKDKRLAAMDGRSEIGFAAVSITMVDVVVFFPMALVPGLVGSLIKEFSLVIVVSTLSSLFVSFTLTPLLASRIAKLETINLKTIGGKFAHYFELFIKGIIRQYRALLNWSLSHKIIVSLIAFGSLASSFLLITSSIVGTEFLPQADKGELSVFVEILPGARLSETENKVHEIEKTFQRNPFVIQTFSTVGYQNDGFSEKYNSNIATINVKLIPTEKRKMISLAGLSRQLRDSALLVTGVKVRVSAIGLFGANEAPIQVKISAENRDSLTEMANQIVISINQIPGILNARLSTEKNKRALSLLIDKDKTAELGLSAAELGSLMRASYYGMDEATIRINGKEEATRISIDSSERTNANQAALFAIPAAPNQPIYLHQLGKIVPINAATSLERSAKEPSITLLADVLGRPVGDVGVDIQQKMEQLHLPNNIHIKYEGDLEQQGDSFTDLGLALLASLILIYLIMVVLYNNWTYPFIVLLSIPLALSGAILALALTAKSINIFSIFGLIMLMGLVAKNGILLVDKANQLLGNEQHNKQELKKAIIEAGATRLRPILMTTLAMVIGMLPLATAHGASAAFSSGLAWVLIGGLSSSMLLTLIIVPTIYYVMATMKMRFTKPASIVVLYLFVTFIGKPQTAEAQTYTLSIHEAITKGLAENDNLKMSALATKQSDYALKEAISYQYPQANLAMEYYRNIKPSIFFLPTFGISSQQTITYDATNFQAIPASSKNAYNANVNIAIPIFNAPISGQIKSARLNQNMAMANNKMQQWLLADQIRKAYLNILLMQANLQLANAAWQRADRNLSDSKRLMQKGYAMAIDTLNAWSNLSLMAMNRGKANTLLQQSENFLKSLINMDIESNISLSDSLSTTNHLSENTFLDSLQQRPDFLVNKAKQELATQEIENSKALSKPSLSFVSQYTLQSQSDNFNFNKYRFPNSFFVGLQLNIPLFNGFRTEAKVAQNKLQLQQAQLEAEALEKNAKAELINTSLDISNNKQKIFQQANIIRAKEKILQLISDRWQKGFAKYTDVADAELELIKAQTEQAQNQFDLFNSVTNYWKSTGYIN